jgi:hypothetical protein
MLNEQTSISHDAEPQRRRVAPRHDRAWWDAHYRDWRAGEKTKAQFCRERGLNVNSFDNWCRKFRRADSTQRRQTQFIPVTVAPSQVTSPVTISVGDVSIRFDAGMAPDALGPWLQAMRGASC